MPTLNRAHLLPRAVASVFDQTHHDWELIIVDDGSTDDTADVVASFDDSRLVYLRLGDNVGVSRARNVGLDRASGDYVAFLDSDDEYHAGKLEAQVTRFVSNPHRLPQLGVVLGATQWLTSPEIVTRAEDGDTWGGWVSELIWEYPRHTWSTMMVRRDHLESVGGFDERLRASEFFDLSIRLAQECQFDGTRDALTILRPDPNTRGWNVENAALAAEILVDKHDFSGRHARRTRADLYMKIGRHRAVSQGLGSAVHPMIRAVAADPHPRLLRTIAGVVRDRLRRP
jgi:glycosyltransferase involved in cell wall biosynthesis